MSSTTQDSSAAARIFDANANRAAEALRVIEDVARFGLNDAVLSQATKELRHNLQTSLHKIPSEMRLLSRDTPGDVGTSIATAAEGRREDLQSVAVAACKRLQQALRSMEESAKVLAFSVAASASLATELEQLRYASYSLEKTLVLLHSHAERLAACRLCVLMDCRNSSEEFTQLATQILTAGAHMVQLRDKTATDRTLLQRGRLLQQLTSAHDSIFIMNDRVDLALATGADGVHVGQTELPVAEVRQIAGDRLLVGVSTRNASQLEQAVTDGASYVGVGPMFTSTTKNFSELAGLDYARAAVEKTSLPMFAIGGITQQNAAAVLETGVHGLAAQAAVVDAASPGSVVTELLGQFT
jgi:thiamine-phosphate pyrophosphorylase